MSRIGDLIRELCPNGVEFRLLADVARLRRGTSITRGNTSPGTVPVIAGGRSPAYFNKEGNRSGGVVVVAGSGAYAGFVSYWREEVFVSDAFSIEPNSDQIEAKFIFYLMKSAQSELHAMKSGGGVPHVYPRDLAGRRIPVPPIEVQREIVRILDTFSKLEAELEARRKQYTFYRDQLLTFTERERDGSDGRK